MAATAALRDGVAGKEGEEKARRATRLHWRPRLGAWLEKILMAEKYQEQRLCANECEARVGAAGVVMLRVGGCRRQVRY